MTATKVQFSFPLFKKMPLVGILRGYRPEQVQNILKAGFRAGLTTFEITMNTEGATQMIGQAAMDYAGKMNIGAGTVCTEADLEAALSAGAQFIVTPILNELVVETCKAKAVAVFCGALTPTEIHRAWSLGVDMVKLFPAELHGPAYLKSVLAPLDQIAIMPTGGVGPDNMKVYWQYGAKAFGMGSKLLDKELIRREDWIGLEQHFAGLCTYFHNEVA